MIRTLARAVTGLLSVLWSIAVTVGAPAALVLAGRYPTWPDGAPSSVRDVWEAIPRHISGSDTWIVVTLVLWALWVWYLWHLIAEVALRVRDHNPNPHRARHTLAARLSPARVLATVVLFLISTQPPLALGHGGSGVVAAKELVADQHHRSHPIEGGATGASLAQRSEQADVHNRPREGQSYVVTARDATAGLSGVALRVYGDATTWPLIYHANHALIGTDPNLIYPGQQLLIPPLPTDGHTKPAARHHRVDDRDAAEGLSGIALRFYGDATTWPLIYQANRALIGADPNLIQPGQQLIIPPPPPPHAAAETHAPQQDSETHRPDSAQHHRSDGRHGTDAEHSETASPPAVPPATGGEAHRPPPQEQPHLEDPDGGHRADAEPDQDAADGALPSLVAFTGGGLLLAGGLAAALVRYRRRQFRWRRPGRTISATPPSLQRVEQAVVTAGDAGAADVQWLDQALRSLTQTLSARKDAHLPDLLAVRMTDDTFDLVLTGAVGNPPAPWSADESGTRWSIHRTDDLPYQETARGHHFAPYPTLVSVGYSPGGDRWLLDLERIGALSLTGDQERCRNLARFIAAELAHNTWSDILHVTLVGVGAEMAQLNPDRLTYTDDLHEAIHTATTAAVTTRDALHAGGLDVLTGRLHNLAGDAWAPHVLLAAPPTDADTADINQLLRTLRDHEKRAALAVVLTGETAPASGTRWQLTLHRDGTLHIPALDLTLTAHQIPANEAADLAQMLALAANTDDRRVPDADGGRDWEQHTDTAGAPRPALRDTPTQPQVHDRDAASAPEIDSIAPEPTDSEIGRSISLLPRPTGEYLDQTATTEDDLHALSPQISQDTRHTLQNVDPRLDADLADWHDPTNPRPRVRLLGPVTVTGQDSLPAAKPRVAWNTEIAAYLATRPRGVSVDEFGTALWPNDPDIAAKTKPRQAISIARHWLGINPRTGDYYIPKGIGPADPYPYRLEDALVDAELFRRLRLRATTRGADGITDLQAALDLVTGEPFAQRRKDGYSWLTDGDGDRLDYIYQGMIVDVAHIVATHHLAENAPELAVRAARVALSTGTHEDIPLLDLIAACDAQGSRAEADQYVKQILTNHDAEIEEDLPPRTADILHRRQWLARPEEPDDSGVRAAEP